MYLNDNLLLLDLPEIKHKYVNGNLMKINENNFLDQYFTKSEVAKYIYNKIQNIVSKYDNIDAYKWIEPSAGNGVFYNLLPEDKRIGVDINPFSNEIIKSDYLKFELQKNEKYIVIGNPPFGHRGVMALNFINHSQSAEYVCFILPMFFESKGKGSIKYRVKGFNLLHSEKLNDNSFYNPNNQKNVDVKCVFQIWSKHHKSEKQEFSWYKNKSNEPFGEYLKVFTVSLAKKRECGKRWIYDEKADFYLSSTFHNNISIVETFDQVKYKSGVAVVFTTKNETIKEKLLTLFKNTDWTKYGSLATNSCYHIGKSNIFEVVQDNLHLINTKE